MKTIDIDVRTLVIGTTDDLDVHTLVIKIADLSRRLDVGIEESIKMAGAAVNLECGEDLITAIGAYQIFDSGRHLLTQVYMKLDMLDLPFKWLAAKTNKELRTYGRIFEGKEPRKVRDGMLLPMLGRSDCVKGTAIAVQMLFPIIECTLKMGFSLLEDRL